MHGGSPQEIVLVLAAAVAVPLVLQRVRVPGVAAVIVAGALIGPHGLALVRDTESIALLSEVGVVLLLFTIGLEFSLADLRRLSQVMLRLGLPQVVGTVAVVTGLGVAFGLSPSRATFFGFLVALSSTAIVLQALGERGETDAPHGRAILGVLLLQDLCVVPMMLVLPALGGAAGGGSTILLTLLKAVALVVAALAVARVVIPRALGLVARARRRDMFVLAVLLVCAGVAWATSRAGLSLALGAFLAGVVLADSEYGSQALSDVLPLRDTFASLFFISMGMLLDAHVVAEQPGRVAALTVGVVAGKALLVFVVALAARLPRRVAVLAALGLAQVGEFSFVLAEQGARLGLLDPATSRSALAAGVVTMVLTPVAIRLGPKVAALAQRAGLVDVEAAVAEGAREEAPSSGHVVVLGFGLGGQLLAESLRAAGTPYVIVDIDANRVRRARDRGEPVRYGDATSPEVLERAGVVHARNVVLVLNDPEATRRAVRAVRRLAPGVHVTVRSRYLLEVPELERAGASEVVAQEFEATVEIIARVLRAGDVPRNVIAQHVRRARERGGESPRPLTVPRRRLEDTPGLRDLKIESFLVQEGAWVAGRSVADSGLRKRTGVTIVAIGHGGGTAVHPPVDYRVAQGDVLYLVGDGPELRAARSLLQDGPA